VITPTLFAMLVLMALVTTVMTAPLLSLLGPIEAPSARAAVLPASGGVRPSAP
jgi:hypothetical protein